MFWYWLCYELQAKPAARVHVPAKTYQTVDKDSDVPAKTYQPAQVPVPQRQTNQLKKTAVRLRR